MGRNTLTVLYLCYLFLAEWLAIAQPSVEYEGRFGIILYLLAEKPGVVPEDSR